jgi:hypothetical protein
MKNQTTNQSVIVIVVALVLVSIGIFAYGVVSFLALSRPKQSVKVEANTTMVKQSSFEFQSHQYMIMEWTLGRNPAGTEVSGVQLMHDPDCPCKNKK